MSKCILITGATDGIGLVTAKALHELGHRVLVHGRNPDKLVSVQESLGIGADACYQADLSDLEQTRALAAELLEREPQLDVVINNAGVFKMADPSLASGLDARFVVNTLAPLVLTQALASRLGKNGRVVNLSSAAQAPVSLAALRGQQALNDNQAYAQSKLALTSWTRTLGEAWRESGPMLVSVNPASLLGSKMVKDAYGMDGGDLSVGADILVRAAVSDEFANAHGAYYDNDAKRFANPHPQALDQRAAQDLWSALQELI
ncbi:SDR family NAD(P)-dependent oxidoreductase [Paraferrimonas sedimenticola]|uniref:Oxidoreductase n=1 Tax=Paraferrimonas sedimenticola TaxID=375674 RepID=A0AA37RTR0_9GAMM|nr:SDR family NAD(P)-dependent oxidoreductase [Paraferrimonas sedimenticola]GLP95491.1 oxidoreductase [Paraferrimonas sedimenticola]